MELEQDSSYRPTHATQPASSSEVTVKIKGTAHTNARALSKLLGVTVTAAANLILDCAHIERIAADVLDRRAEKLRKMADDLRSPT